MRVLDWTKLVPVLSDQTDKPEVFGLPVAEPNWHLLLGADVNELLTNHGAQFPVRLRRGDSLLPVFQ